MRRVPDFLILGAARAGTTALHAYLRQAPDIFMSPIKETNFFAFEGQDLACRGPGADFINNSVTRLDAYRALFADAPETALCGEASPLYLFVPGTAGRIRHHAPEARLVAILRDPVEQAWSHFLYASRMGVEPLASFTEALMAENDRLAQGWQPMFGYSAFPRYGEQIARYLACFPREQLFIRTYEAWTAEPETVLRDMLAFIGADPDFRPDMRTRPNAGGVPRNRALQTFLMRPNPVTGAFGRILSKPLRRRIRDRIAAFNVGRDNEMEPRARAILHERLDDDIVRLQSLLDLDLRAWRG